MKVIYALILTSLVSNQVFAKANCLRSSSWQCSQQAGSSTGTTVVTNPPAITPAHVATPDNTHLGGSTPDHHNVVLLPSKQITPDAGTKKPGPVIVMPDQPKVITGTSPGAITSTPGPTITGYSPGVVVTIPPPQVIMGYAPGSPTVSPPRSFTGTSPGYIIVPQAPQSFTGYGAVPRPIPVPPKAPPMNVYPDPPKTITGVGQVPAPMAQPTIITAPPKAPPMNVYPDPPKTITGVGQVPTPMAQPTIITAPPKAPPMNVYANPPKTVVGFGQVPPKAPPVSVSPNPPRTFTGYAPAGPMLVGKPGIGPAGQGTHSLSVHRPPDQRPITSGEHQGEGQYSFEFIEPGIQNHRVEVYRSKDAKEQIYKDVIPMDAGDFNLTVMGTRRPHYIH